MPEEKQANGGDVVKDDADMATSTHADNKENQDTATAR